MKRAIALRRLLSQSAVYVVVQLFVFLLDVVVFYAIATTFNQGIIVSNTLSRVVSGSLTFVLHRYLTFPDSQGSNLYKSAGKFFLLLALNVPITSGLIMLFEIAAGSLVTAKIAGDGVYFVFSFLVSKFLIFRSHTR